MKCFEINGLAQVPKFLGQQDQSDHNAQYYFWGWLKDIAYQNRPHNAKERKIRIRETCRSISGKEISHVHRNFEVRTEQCIERNDKHLESLSFI